MLGLLGLVLARRRAAVAKQALALLSALALGCSPRADRTDPSIEDAGLTAPSAAGAVHAVDAARAVARFASGGDQAIPFTRAGERWRAVRTSLPARFRGAVRFDADRGAFLELRALDVADAPLEIAGDAAVFREVALETDAVLSAHANGFEELRVVRRATDRAVLRYRLGLAEGTTLRLREGRVEIVRGARVEIASAPAFAIDPLGARVDAEVSLAGSVATFSFALAGLAPPIVIDPAWSTIPPMSIARTAARGISLGGDRALIAFGTTPLGPAKIAEIYDAAANTWTSTAPSSAARADATLTVLADGRVLAYGNPPDEILDLGTLAWSSVSGATSRDGHTATLLADGRVLLTGGAAASAPSAELFTPRTSSFAATTGALLEARVRHSAVRLLDGRVLVAGGIGTTTLSTAELFDPATGKFTGTGATPFAAGFTMAGRLADGRVFVLGGANGALYNPATGSWSSIKPPGTFGVVNACDLGSGDYYLAMNGSYPQVWRSATDVAVRASRENLGRLGAAVVGMPPNRVLLAGGMLGSATTATAALFTRLSLGEACGQPGYCGSLVCADGVCCNRACNGSCESCAKTGTCSPITGLACAPGHGLCGAYLSCVGGACATSCALDTECIATKYCVGGACQDRYPTGVACSRDGECTSGFCVDGVCCGSACNGQCAACDLAASKGTCKVVAGAPHGARPSCAGAGAGSACGPRCDGADASACHFPIAAPCSLDACVAGMETHASTCDGKGACNDVPKSCAAFACGAKTCGTSCGVDGDCAQGFHCGAGACVRAAGLGEPCIAAAACGTGHCVDGVCCAAAS